MLFLYETKPRHPTYTKFTVNEHEEQPSAETSGLVKQITVPSATMAADG